MRFLFYPATMPSRVRWVHPNATPTGWVQEPVTHPGVLCSYYHWRSDKKTRFHPEVEVFGDSGGFSVWSLGAEIDPRDVLRWQRRVCTIGCILDIPPYHRDRSLAWENLEVTAHNVRVGLRTYQEEYTPGERFRWWGVIQGPTHKHRVSWYNTIARIYPFESEGEGWAVKPLPSGDPVATAACLYTLRTLGIRRAHLLMNAGRRSVSVILALGLLDGFEFLTTDASSADQNAMHRVIYRNSETLSDLIEERYEKTGPIAERWMREKCPCTSCEWFREDYPPGTTVPRDGTYLSQRMIFHNVLMLKAHFQQLQQRCLEEGPEAFLRTQLTAPTYNAVMRAWEGQEPEWADRGSPRSLLNMV